MVVWKYQKITFKICLVNIFTKCDQMPMRSSLLYLIGVLVALWFQLKDVQGVWFHKIDYWDQDNAISHWCAHIPFYQSSYTSDSTGHISGCLTMYIWSLGRLYISWLWCQVHKAWVSFLTYIPSTCSIIIKMEQTGRMMTNFHFQYLRSFRVQWSSWKVWGCSLWNHCISII